MLAVDDNGWHQHYHTKRIELLYFLLPGLSCSVRSTSLRIREEQPDDKYSDAADRKVDVEAPTPRHSIGESTTHQGPRDTGYAVHAADSSRVNRSFGKWN